MVQSLICPEKYSARRPTFKVLKTAVANSQASYTITTNASGVSLVVLKTELPFGTGGDVTSSFIT